MTRLLLASSRYHAIVDIDGELYARQGVNFVDRRFADVANRDLFLRAAKAKWGFYRVIGPDGAEAPELQGQEIPPLKFATVGGEHVLQVA